MLIDKVPWVVHMLGRSQVRVASAFESEGLGGKRWEGVVGCSAHASTSLFRATYASPVYLVVDLLKYI